MTFLVLTAKEELMATHKNHKGGKKPMKGGKKGGHMMSKKDMGKMMKKGH